MLLINIYSKCNYYFNRILRIIHTKNIQYPHLYLPTFKFFGCIEMEGVGLVKPQLFGLHFSLPYYFTGFLGSETVYDVFGWISCGNFPIVPSLYLQAGLKAASCLYPLVTVLFLYFLDAKSCLAFASSP